jgi:(1->4)-alpha-D-glucan 1-alpha-D-glucosylmutase
MAKQKQHVSDNQILTTLHSIIMGRYIPGTTYRLQLNQSFTFQQAIQYLPYLKEMGFDTVYCSPYFQAEPGSPHGYNVTDPHVINPEIGSVDEYNHFCSVLDQNGLSQIIDLVPNHMGITGNNNKLWFDVLQNGPASRYATFFDIDWHPVKEELLNKVLLPILGDQYGNTLENQEIMLYINNGEFFIHYYSHILPLAPETFPLILEHQIDDLKKIMEEDSFDYLEYLSICTAFHNLPSRTDLESEQVETRYRETAIAIHRFTDLISRNQDIHDFVESRIKIFNGTKEVPSSFDLLDNLLNQQAYRLAFWRVAGEEINYRRFFDVNELAAIRIEDEAVFDHYHELLFQLITERKVKGLRLDHSDGLYNPAAYFDNLQVRYLREMTMTTLKNEGKDIEEGLEERIDTMIRDHNLHHGEPLYLVIEKILERKEQLPEDWSVNGTTGYDFLNPLNGLFIDSGNEKEITDIYTKFTGVKLDLEELIHNKKRIYSEMNMPSEINTLANRLKRIAEKDRHYRDFTLPNLTKAIREIIAAFPVYRTYITADTDEVSLRDITYIKNAINRARHKSTILNPRVFDYLEDILTLALDAHTTDEEQEVYRDFVLRFQQITSPIMAKGVEDTVFYINNRFISLNEVGSDPSYFGYSNGEFHKQQLERQRHWPHSMITTSTHDTKRSEDIRMRLNVLSEIPDEWKLMVNRWARINKKHKRLINDTLFPDRNIEYFIYQTLTGVWPDYPIEATYWPVFMERIQQYVLKSAREAKMLTNWINPNMEYEESLKLFVEKILDKRKSNRFLAIFLPFQQKIAGLGMLNSLSATCIKTTSPGVVDFYQGTELWNYYLVDPDNRAEVDYDLRWHLLSRVRDLWSSEISMEEKTSELLHDKRDSRIKIFLIWKALCFRKSCSSLFLDGEYIALECEGENAESVVAFMRKLDSNISITVAARYFTRILESHEDSPANKAIWKNTRLMLHGETGDKPFIDIFTGTKTKVKEKNGVQYLPLTEIFKYFSFSILTNSPDLCTVPGQKKRKADEKQ